MIGGINAEKNRNDNDVASCNSINIYFLIHDEISYFSDYE